MAANRRSADAYDRLFIGGDWVGSTGADAIDVIAPSTELVIGRAPEATAQDVDRAVLAARAAFDEGEWPRLTPSRRAEYLTALARAYQPHVSEMASASMWVTLMPWNTRPKNSTAEPRSP